MNQRRKPSYFNDIYQRTVSRWDLYDKDPELAAPLKLLFSQVQSPRHVLSELLQNADDVGAIHVVTKLYGNVFFFEHDGRDFNKEEFDSLCKFAFSNKTKLHTIGFRGIGFKSTFSLGEKVYILTPSLAVCFNRTRFTLPVWIEDATVCDETRITVGIQDSRRKNELEKNLKEWTLNPASLLFFNNIKKLTIENITLQKEVAKRGPTDNSFRIKLTGHSLYEVFLFVSKEELFPQDVIDEIRHERNLEDLHFTSCHVDIVTGLPGEQRLYVVLPTGVKPEIPFSCNAPFLQDPARSSIKSPSLSPTNRWLLLRIGKLAGEIMLDWLNNRTLSINERAKAYSLMPNKNEEYDSLDSDVTSAICEGFNEVIKDKPFLLTQNGELVSKRKCISPPYQIYEIWTQEQILRIFANNQKHVLSQDVCDGDRQKMSSWDYIDPISVNDFINQLSNGKIIPKPDGMVNLFKLWEFVQQNKGYHYWGEKSRQLSIVPVKGSDLLFPSNQVVRIPSKKESISEEAWEFLLNLLNIVDYGWIRYLNDIEKKNEKGDNYGKSAIQLLRETGLYYPTETNTIIKNACQKLFSLKYIPAGDNIRMAHLMAALDAKTPEEFRFLARDNRLKDSGDHVLAIMDSQVEELIPDDWAKTNVLHADYFKDFSSCTFQQWKDWIKDEKSGLWPFAPFQYTMEKVWFRNKLDQILMARNVNSPKYYPYVTNEFILYDYDFDKSLTSYWNTLLKADLTIWAKVVYCILNASHWYWNSQSEARIIQVSTTSSRSWVTTDSIPAVWIIRLKSLPCLFDTFGKARIPSELYMRNPETEPFLGVEPFVKAELDTETTKPLLRKLGVRETPADLGKLVELLRTLSLGSDPVKVLSEILRWYGALDRAMARVDSEQLDQIKRIFTKVPLILTNEGKWTRISEVFVSTSEEFPDAPTVHSAVSNLSLWIRLGVANHPTADLILNWLGTVPENQNLDQDTVRRIRAALQRFHTQIWQTLQHWLAIDNTWRNVDSLRYRLTMQSLTKYADFFPSVKAKCANFLMLDSLTSNSGPFLTLPDIGAIVEYKLTKRPSKFVDPLLKPKWITTLSQQIKRITVTDEIQKRHINNTAELLEDSVWLTFEGHDSVEVTPYIENTPAGIPQSRNVLWYEKFIFIKEGSLAKSYNDIVNELARPFAFDSLTEAIKACIDRSDGFIVEYMKENFKLEDETIKKATTLPISKVEKESDNGKDDDEVDEENKIDTITDDGTKETPSNESGFVEEKEPEKEADNSARHNKIEITFFERYAIREGYRWNEARKRFIHPDGSWIERSFPPFQWKLKNVAMNTETDFWVSQHCLLRSGVEIPFELWGLIEHYPQTISLILEDEEGNPTELTGRKIVSLSNTKKIQLFPSKYRLKMVESN
jgi:hypothetical protein